MPRISPLELPIPDVQKRTIGELCQKHDLVIAKAPVSIEGASPNDAILSISHNFGDGVVILTEAVEHDREISDEATYFYNFMIYPYWDMRDNSLVGLTPSQRMPNLEEVREYIQEETGTLTPLPSNINEIAEAMLQVGQMIFASDN